MFPKHGGRIAIHHMVEPLCSKQHIDRPSWHLNILSHHRLLTIRDPAVESDFWQLSQAAIDDEKANTTLLSLERSCGPRMETI